MELPPRYLHQPLNVSQTETLLLPQTGFSEDEATRLPCQKWDIILDNSLFFPNTPAQTLSLVDLILPLINLARCVHFPQSSTVSFLVQTRAVSLSRVLPQPLNPYELLTSSPFSILWQECSF